TGAAVLATLAAGSLVVIAVGANPSARHAHTHVRTAASAPPQRNSPIAAPSSSAPRTATSTSTATTGMTVAPPTTVAPRATTPSTQVHAANPPPTTPSLLVTRLTGIGAARQVVTVVLGG